MVEITIIEDSDKLEKNNNDGWNELMGSDLVMKVIGSSGESKDIEPREAVLVTFEGRIAKNRSIVDGPLFQRAESWLIVVGESDVVSALDMGIRFMKVGQTAYIWSHYKFGLGNGTRTIIGENKEPNKLQAVPPNSNVLYKVNVTQKVRDTSKLNPYFTIQKALSRKKIANDIYQNEWCQPPEKSEDPDCDFAMRRAIRLYTKAAQEMQTLLQGTYFHTVEKDHPQRDQTKQILLDSLNNIVAVRLKQQRYHEAKTAAIEVLKVEPSNVKALLRAAKAVIHDPASNIEEATVAIEAAEASIAKGKSKSMNQKELKRLKIALKEKQVDYNEKSKEMFGNRLRSRPVAVSKKEQAKSDHAMLSETQPEQQRENEKNPIFGRNDISTLLMQTIVPLIGMLLVKFLYDKSLINR